MDKVTVYTGSDGDYWWRRVAPNGQVTGGSEEGYKNLSYAIEVAQKRNKDCLVSVEGGKAPSASK